MAQGTEDASPDRAEAIAAILAMVPPPLGGREQALRNLEALTSGKLAAMRARLEAALAAVHTSRGNAIPPDPAAGLERAAGHAKVFRGLDRLRAATAAIGALRKGATGEKG